MLYFIDTGILLRIFERSDPHHPNVVNSLKKLRKEGHSFATAPQNIAEFWNVTTRPASSRGGLGRSAAAAKKRLHFIERFGTVLPEAAGMYEEWKRLVDTYGVMGAAVHDTRLVALMNVAGITHILTLNPSDFARFPEIAVVSPADVLR